MRRNIDLFALAVLLAATGLLGQFHSLATFHGDSAKMLAATVHRFEPVATSRCWAHLAFLSD